MQDVSQRSLATTLLGHNVTVPFGVAPTGMQQMAHPGGEVATAQAFTITQQCHATHGEFPFCVIRTVLCQPSERADAHSHTDRSANKI
ncbi:Peroxisomal (S)-2-hydroxy-acid oxidase GLO5 [Portunus trituberculatus]|uniref:Peroxisomal (S)-2-hydroxy-acid oxidase GLO5 n=1 Tax=Portunus trituberculatus TaxID=210409 RepID=A0A5B7I6F4_PORTR|nr:Peroxisomal (S)-2-hydroxy-acid oxidase GLO5 [Portunus trituberculatus]